MRLDPGPEKAYAVSCALSMTACCNMPDVFYLLFIYSSGMVSTALNQNMFWWRQQDQLIGSLAG